MKSEGIIEDLSWAPGFLFIYQVQWGRACSAQMVKGRWLRITSITFQHAKKKTERWLKKVDYFLRLSNRVLGC